VTLRAEVGDPAASWVSEELPGVLAQALATAGRARVPATVRIQAVILGPSSGGQGPNNVAELVSDATTRDARDSDATASIPCDVEKNLRTAGI
jgi:hypothetical protein